jgi:hypothetical protein
MPEYALDCVENAQLTFNTYEASLKLKSNDPIKVIFRPYVATKQRYRFSRPLVPQ